MTALEDEIDVLTESVSATPTTLRSVIKDTVNTTVDTDAFTPINEQIAYQTNILEKVFEKELLAIMGFGDGSDGEILTSQTVTVIDQQLPAKIQATNVNLASGQTITVNKPCAGLYIYSQGDIIIDGSIVMTNLGYNSNVVPETVTVKGVEYRLARGGKSGNSLASGAGGMTNSSYNGNIVSSSAGGSGNNGQDGEEGNHCFGGMGIYTKGGGGAHVELEANGNIWARWPGSSSGGKGYSNEKPSGAIALIARGEIMINGALISVGEDCSGSNNGSDGSSDYNSPNRILAASGGKGGDSLISGFGGGPITLVAKKITVNGTINNSGGTGKPNASVGKTGRDASYVMEEAVVLGYGGKGGYGAEAGLPGEVKQYLI